MLKKVMILKNRYVDSVTLMSAGEQISVLPGVDTADALMGTPANVSLLSDSGFDIPKDVCANDLMLAISCESEDIHTKASGMFAGLLNPANQKRTCRSIDEIDMDTDPYNMVQISLPGEYAAVEARRALEKGLDVFMFSDNVPIEQERELKLFARENDLLCMGPDCGVGLIGGVALAAGSIVREGGVGIVGASGSGAQEAACVIEKCGYGVSAIIGTGGRDLYPEIGGLTMLQGIDRLSTGRKPKVILLVSKLADLSVMENVLKAAGQVKKPVVAVFLGADKEVYAKYGVHGADSLEQAALEAVRQMGGETSGFALTDREIEEIAAREAAKYNPSQKCFRALYCGGTFAEEALIYFNKNNPETEFFSNLKTKYTKHLENCDNLSGHAVIDLGAPEFTKDTPHPVFDPAIRLKVFERELVDESVAAILLDFITGPGVHHDPVTTFADLYVKSGRGETVTVIASICGSQGDPQNVAEKEELLRKSGMLVTKSNFQSVRLAGEIIRTIENGGKV